MPAPVEYDLSVEELGFSYPLPVAYSDQPGDAQFVEEGRLRSALDEVSFTLSAGKKLAVVGVSGAGKSTLINLLLRFWDYQQGSLKLDGQELKHYRPGDVRAGMAVVAQDTYLFHSTIRENLLLARPSASPAELSRAIELAQLDEFLSSLPDGLDTRVGEQGVRISAGQRQRLAIARAILKSAPLLLLDEPTANLDALTEQALLHDLFLVLDGQNVLYISHRLVGMERMDEILVMRNGRIIERGSHADLLAQDGAYRKMYEIQHRIIE